MTKLTKSKKNIGGWEISIALVVILTVFVVIYQIRIPVDTIDCSLTVRIAIERRPALDKLTYTIEVFSDGVWYPRMELDTRDEAMSICEREGVR